MDLRIVRIQSVMVTKVISIRETDPFSYVEEKLRVNKIRHLPVVDIDHKLVGIITQRDFQRTAPPRRSLDGDDVYDPDMLDSFILKHFMTPDPLTLKPENSIMDAVEIMATRKFGCIPIVDDTKKLVGVVTQIDVLKWLYRTYKGAA